MTARLLDGKALAATIRAEVANDAQAMRRRGIVPGLAVVLLGDDPPSQMYVRSKGKATVEAGMHSETVLLPAATPAAELLAVIDRLNADPAIHGILVQTPLPGHLPTRALLARHRSGQGCRRLSSGQRRPALGWRGRASCRARRPE